MRHRFIKEVYICVKFVIFLENHIRVRCHGVFSKKCGRLHCEDSPLLIPDGVPHGFDPDKAPYEGMTPQPDGLCWCISRYHSTVPRSGNEASRNDWGDIEVFCLLKVLDFLDPAQLVKYG